MNGSASCEGETSLFALLSYDRADRRSSTCSDIDECIENAHRCQYQCENQIGSYRCYCPIGFKMNQLGQCQGESETLEPVD